MNLSGLPDLLHQSRSLAQEHVPEIRYKVEAQPNVLKIPDH